MSDDQIRDLIDSAEEWSPDVDENQDDDDGGGGAAGPNLPLPPLQLGSDVEIATCVAQVLRHERGKVIFSKDTSGITSGRIGARSMIRRCAERYTVMMALWSLVPARWRQ